MEKGEKKLDEELDIIKIIESIRMINKEDERNYIIDLDEDLIKQDTSNLDKTQIINQVIEMQTKQFENRNQNNHNKKHKVVNRNKIINNFYQRQEFSDESKQEGNNLVEDQFESILKEITEGSSALKK